MLVKRSLKFVEPVFFHQAFLWLFDIFSAIVRKRAIAKIAVNRSNIRSETRRFEKVLFNIYKSTRDIFTERQDVIELRECHRLTPNTSLGCFQTFLVPTETPVLSEAL